MPFLPEVLEDRKFRFAVGIDAPAQMLEAVTQQMKIRRL